QPRSLGEQRPFEPCHGLALRHQRELRRNVLDATEREQHARLPYARVARKGRAARRDALVGGKRRAELAALLVQPRQQKIIAKPLLCGGRRLTEPNLELACSRLGC